MATSELTISVTQLRELLEHGEPVTVLDVRSAVDRAEWAIPGSIHIDAYAALKVAAPTALDEAEFPRDQPVVTVCGAGKVAELATARLRARGYDARTLVGGMRAWSLAWNYAPVPLSDHVARVIQIRRTGKGCLSYIVGADGAAAVIDASVDPEVYCSLASEQGWTIVAVLDTHVHADHLSRSRHLAATSGARLYLPASARVTFPFEALDDGDTIAIGGATLTTWATPGHTVESATYLLGTRAAFTGDTLFLEGVGRPDLAAGSAGSRGRAEVLYHSLRRLLALPAETLILPGHTSSPVAFDQQPIAAPLGKTWDRNPALRRNEDTFVTEVLARIPPTPPNHARIVALNEAGTAFSGDPTELEGGANRCAVPV